MDSISLSSGNKLAGRYRVLQKLGEGSFAETFLAEDEHLPDAFRCVIKKLKTTVEEDSKLQIAKRLFDAEARILHQLGNHGQIPQLLAHFEEDGEFYLVEDFVEGNSLYQELAAGQQWSEGYVIKLVQDILDVLKYVHQKQIIHRDIKPSNIIRREKDGGIVLIDFGAVKNVTAQASDDSSMAAPHTVIVGTPGYMPGEQLRGLPRTSSDVYAVGMIAIYALTGLNPALGQLPEDETTAEILWQDRASISPEFATILNKMVAYDFRQRYPSATEAFDAIQALTLHRQGPEPTILKEASSAIGIPAGSGVGSITYNNTASGSSGSGVIPASSLEKTSISTSEPSSAGTYVISDASPSQIERSKSDSTASSRPLSKLKIFAFSGAAVLGLGAIAALASPNIKPICTALNNCSAEVKFRSVYDEAVSSAESAETGILGAKSLKDLQTARGQLQTSVQKLAKIPDAVGSYDDAKKLIPAYQTRLNGLEEKIAIETKAQQDLKQAEVIAGKVLTQKKPSESVAALTEDKAQLQKAIERIDKIPEKSLSSPERQKQKQAYQQQVKTLDTQIGKRAAVESERERQAARTRPSYNSPSASEPQNSDPTNTPLWGGNSEPAPAAPPPSNNWGSSASNPQPQEAPPPAAEPEAPLWGGGNSSGQSAAPPPAEGNGGGSGGQEPLW